MNGKIEIENSKAIRITKEKKQWEGHMKKRLKERIGENSNLTKYHINRWSLKRINTIYVL
jgi:hypothetical protein